MCSIRIFKCYTPQGYVFLDTVDTREYAALQLSAPSFAQKVRDDGIPLNDHLTATNVNSNTELLQSITSKQ